MPRKGVLMEESSMTPTKPSRKQSPPPRAWRTARQLGALVRPFQGTVILLLVLSVVAVAIEVVPPLLQKVLVDQVLLAQMPEGRSQLLWMLLAIVAGLLLIRIAAAVVGVMKGWISSRVGATLTATLRCELVRKLNELPLAFHDRHQVGVLMSRVAYDTENLHTLIYHITGGFLLQSLQMIAIGISLFCLNPELAAVTILPMPLMLAGGFYFTRYLNPRHSRYWEAVGRQASALTGMLSGIRVVKTFVQEEREIDRFSQFSQRLCKSRMLVDISSAAFTALMGLLFAFGGLAVWYIGGRDVLAGKMTLGSLTAFLMYLTMFYTPLSSIAESVTWFSSFYATSRRLFEVIDEPGEAQSAASGGGEKNLPQQNLLQKIDGRIEFQKVFFGYDPGRPVLKGIDLEIRPGEMVGVMGRSGSGKSTLVSLIARLYSADSGQVLIDGVDVRQVDPRRLRRSIGMVPQEPFLFGGTLAENVAYGSPDASPEQIILAANRADAHGFIMRKPLAYESPLGEGGMGLSGGERQRLSIARALLVDPAILILDEATASVDAESERAICRAIRRFARQRTTIVISHRLSTLDEVDMLFVFDQGRLVEQGTRRQLQVLNGLYASLARLQRDSVEVADDELVAARTAREEKSTLSEASRSQRQIGRNGEFSVAAPTYPDGQQGAGDDSGLPENGELNWLDDAGLRISADTNGLLTLEDDRCTYAGVLAVAAFPATHPQNYISLRYTDPSGHETELGVLRNLDALAPNQRELVAAVVNRQNPIRRVVEIGEIRTEGNILLLSVVTEQGPAQVRMEKAGESFQRYRDDGLLLTGEGGSYFLVPNRKALSKYAQRLLTLHFGE
jgi:ATP-binding cassette, subfamily B, bacterial